MPGAGAGDVVIYGWGRFTTAPSKITAAWLRGWLPGPAGSRSSPAALRRELGQLLGVASVHNMKFLLLALKSGSADLLIE
jgi:hypothetical protein